MGHWTYVVGLSVYAYEQGGTTAVGIISVLRLLPAAIASPFLATLADRYRRERVMMGTDLIRAALMALAAVVIATGGPPLIVYAVVVLTNLVGRRLPAGAGCAPAGACARSCRAVGGERGGEHARRRLDLRRAGDRRHHPRALERRRPSSGSTRLWFLSSAALLVGLRAPAPRRLPLRRRPANRPGFFSELRRACAPSRAIATCRR